MSTFVQFLIRLVLLTLCAYGVTARHEGGKALSMAAAQGKWAASTVHVSITSVNRVKYPRTAEVNEKCPRLTLGELQSQHSSHSSPWTLMEKLSFRQGDWEQAKAGVSPIMPFLQLNEKVLPAKMQLASFWVTDVANKQDSVLQVSGCIELVIIDANWLLPSTNYGAHFEMSPGFSSLTIEVEGIYQPTENEDVVCLLGCTFLPSPDGINFSNIQNSAGTKKLERNCDIQVQLHYPLTFNLTSRIVRGTIQSLVTHGERFDFSPVNLSSQMSVKNVYEATARNLVDTACSNASESEASVDSFEASLEEFCELTKGYLANGLLIIEPNWKCNGSVEYCRKIGPFSRYGEPTAFLVDYNTSKAQILVQNFQSKCFSDEGIPEIPVSLVLRLVPADEPLSLAAGRSAIDGQTVVAEGYWENGSNGLCMVGCKLNDASGQADICNARIRLHVPLSLSIKRRNIFEGSISSLLPHNDPDSFPPLGFHVELEYNRNFPRRWSSSLKYNYSRLDEAGAVLSKHEVESNKIKASWLKYPSLIGEHDGHYRSLAEDLSLHHSLKISKESSFTYLEFDLVAIDGFLSFLWSGVVEAVETEPINLNDTIVTETNPKWTNRHQEMRKYLNCSGTMSFEGLSPNGTSMLRIYTEGYYNPRDGKMYMVGCRSVKASWQVMSENSFDLSEGMDCEIEIVLEYPTTLASWLLHPSVKVKVHSNRPADDPFHFVEINVETYPILYQKQRQNLVSQKSVEGTLSILTLSLMLVCIVSQLLYVDSHTESTPYISLLMLGIQAMGYAIPLVTGAESLLARKFDYRRDFFFQEGGWTQIIIYLDKILTLVALLFLLRLFEKVCRERAQISLQQAISVPHERNVFFVCFIAHAFGFLSVMALHSRNSPSSMPKFQPPVVLIPLERMAHANVSGEPPPFVTDMTQTAGPVWRKVLQEYAGLVEDLFLLPQVVAFSMWQVKGKPLRLLFFVGLTFLQIVPHVYDHLRGPGFGGYGYTMFANPSFDFYTNVGNILIPFVALLLAMLLYIQQRWKCFLQFSRRFLYQQLGAKNNETELIITNGRSHLPSIPEDDE